MSRITRRNFDRSSIQRQNATRVIAKNQTLHYYYYYRKLSFEKSNRNFKNVVVSFLLFLFFRFPRLNPIRKIHKNIPWTITTDYTVVVAAGLSPSAFVNINSPYIPEPGFITPMNREGDGLQWAGKLRTVYIGWRRYDGGGGVCERTSVKSGASIMQRGGSPETVTPDTVVAQLPPSPPVHGLEIN